LVEMSDEKMAASSVGLMAAEWVELMVELKVAMMAVLGETMAEKMVWH